MPKLIQMALGAFLSWAFPRVLAALGIYAVSQVISTQIYDYLKGLVTAQFGSVGPQFLNVLYLSGVYDAVFIVLSAYIFAIAIKGLKSISGTIPTPAP